PEKPSHNQIAALQTGWLFHKTNPATLPFPSAGTSISGNCVAVTFGVNVGVIVAVGVEVAVTSGVNVFCRIEVTTDVGDPKIIGWVGGASIALAQDDCPKITIMDM